MIEKNENGSVVDKKSGLKNFFKRATATILVAGALTSPIASEASENTSGLKNQIEISSVSEDNKEQLVNQSFSDFLNGVGDYSEDKLVNKLSYFDFERRDLGFFALNGDKDFMVQTVLIHYETVNLNQYLALGIKNKKGERAIYVVEWITGLITKLENKGAISSVESSPSEKIPYSTVVDTTNLLKDRVGDCIIPIFSFKDDQPPEGFSVNYTNFCNYLNGKISTNCNFLAGLQWPKKLNVPSHKNLFNKVKNIKSKVDTIDSLSDMKEKISSGDNIPTMWTFEYKKNQ